MCITSRTFSCERLAISSIAASHARGIRSRPACILILVREKDTVENNNAMLGRRREERAVVATAREARLKRGCFQCWAGQSHPSAGEHLKKRPGWLDFVVPAVRILVSNRRENRNARKMLLKFKSEELDCLRSECLICHRIVVTRPGRKLLVLRSPTNRHSAGSSCSVARTWGEIQKSSPKSALSRTRNIIHREYSPYTLGGNPPKKLIAWNPWE
jgi:hypothetical protein